MKKIIFALIFISAFSACRGDSEKSNLTIADSSRYPVYADKFYAADPNILKKSIETFLKDAKLAKSSSVIALIVPHAGYIYSGQIAADAYNQVRKNIYDIVVILGTNHSTAGFSKFGVYPRGEFISPIGSLKIDENAAKELLNENSNVVEDLSVHAKEHSIEVQIPFIKYLFPDVKILPIIVGESNIESYSNFGKSLVKILKGKKALIVASSDLSHYPTFDDAIVTDNKTLQAISTLNMDDILKVTRTQVENVSGLSTCACGEAPILSAIAAAKELGGESGSIVSYSNSGYNSIGDVDRVVGYGAVAITKEKSIGSESIDSLITNKSYSLSNPDKKALIQFARKTLNQYFDSQTLPLPREMNQILKIKRGAFVTLKKHGELRGCIGHMAENTPLITVIGSMAIQAAFNDPRFGPLTQKELSEIEIEISVLTPYNLIKSANEILLGRDGVLLKKGNHQAVYLPQVATETGWSKEVFLNQLCYKAGLQTGEWKDAQLYTFQADVFSESGLR